MLQLNEKIDRLGADMHWMRDALIEWTQAIEQGGQTNELIEKYCQDDQKKANVMNRSLTYNLFLTNKIKLDAIIAVRSFRPLKYVDKHSRRKFAKADSA